MKNNYKNKISNFFPIPLDGKGIDTILDMLEIKDVPSKTILQYEGEIATKVFLVFKGCLRSYFVKEDGSITEHVNENETLFSNI